MEKTAYLCLVTTHHYTAEKAGSQKRPDHEWATKATSQAPDEQG